MPLPSSVDKTFPQDLPAPPELPALRTHYQQGLLIWLQTPDSNAGLIPMMEALGSVAAMDPSPLWPWAHTLLATIHSGRLPSRVEYRRLASRVDQSLARQAGGEPQDDAPLIQELQDTLAQLDPPIQSPIEALIPRSPLGPTLAATAAILPLMAQIHPPRFEENQRIPWDEATDTLALAWENYKNNHAEGNDLTPETYDPLRHAVFQILEAALLLEHPAPLKLAESLASITDILENAPPSLPQQAALTACIELMTEPGFLEHDALAERVEQLAKRLENCNNRRSHTLDQLFAKEAAEDIELMRSALDKVPPDLEALVEGIQHIQQLAEPLDLGCLTLSAFRLAEILTECAPEVLDQNPGRQYTITLIDLLEQWIDAIGNKSQPDPPPRFFDLLEQLAEHIPNPAFTPPRPDRRKARATPSQEPGNQAVGCNKSIHHDPADEHH